MNAIVRIATSATCHPAPTNPPPSHTRNQQSRRSILFEASALLSIPLSLLHSPIGQASTTAAAPHHTSESETVRAQYNSYAGNYDELDGGSMATAFGFPDLRASLLATARGDVLEVAVGTGLNLQFYQPPQLTSLTAIDLSEGMLEQAQRKASQLGMPPSRSFFRTADVSSLPFEDASFDSVVDTFSLCVFTDPLAALKSMARVVKPTGRVLLLEHSRSTIPPLGWYQDLTAGPVTTMGKGCAWNQNVLQLLQAAGLRAEKVEEHLGGLIVSIVAVKQ